MIVGIIIGIFIGIGLSVCAVYGINWYATKYYGPIHTTLEAAPDLNTTFEYTDGMKIVIKQSNN